MLLTFGREKDVREFHQNSICNFHERSEFGLDLVDFDIVLC